MSVLRYVRPKVRVGDSDGKLVRAQVSAAGLRSSLTCLPILLLKNNMQALPIQTMKEMLRELYAGVDLSKLVQRMLVVMHEVRLFGVELNIYWSRWGQIVIL